MRRGLNRYEIDACCTYFSTYFMYNCLILFECENKCERECAFFFLVMFFCADSVQWRRISRARPAMSTMMMSSCSTYQSSGVNLVSWSSKIGVDHCRNCQRRFCCSGMFDHLPSTSSYSPFRYSGSEGVWCWPALWSSYCTTDCG